MAVYTFDEIASDPAKYIKLAIDFPLIWLVVPSLKTYSQLSLWIHYTVDDRSRDFCVAQNKK